jgi:hypothetical protein
MFKIMSGKTLFTACLLLAAGSAAKAGTLAGTYDGHCDGFSLTTNANGSASGVETGCESGPVAGVRIIKFLGGGSGAAVNENHLPNTVYEINVANHTWQIFTTSGTVLQSGTWTKAGAEAPLADPNLPPTGAP